MYWANISNFSECPDFIGNYPEVLEILICPASSAAVERLFSLCGLRTSNRRNKTKTEIAS